MHVFESFISCIWQLHLHPVLCSQGSAPKPISVIQVLRSIPVFEGESQCLETLQGFCSRLLCSLLITETLSQACVSDHVKPIKWGLSATQIKHAAADKQMLTVSVSRHFPVCFLRCALLTRFALGAHLLLLFALPAFSLSQVTEVHLGCSCSPICGFSGSPHGSAHAHRPQGRCKCLDCCEIAAPGAKLLPPSSQPVPWGKKA